MTRESLFMYLYINRDTTWSSKNDMALYNKKFDLVGHKVPRDPWLSNDPKLFGCSVFTMFEFYSNRQNFWYFFLFPDFFLSNNSRNNRVRNLKQRPKVAHINHMQPASILDWSTKRRLCELCQTGGKSIQFFHDFVMKITCHMSL